MMKKKLDIEITCNETITTRTVYLRESKLQGGRNFKSKLFGTALNEIFKFDKLFRNHTNPKIIWYNQPVNVNISFDNKLILNTKKKEFDSFQRLLKFRNSSKSKRKYAQLINYLSELRDSELVFDGENENYCHAVNRTLKSLKVENIMTLVENYSDYQIALLCKGMKEGKPRLLADTFFKLGKWFENDKQLARNFVKSAIQKYGIEFINFCLDLPSKPFKISNTKHIFSQFEKTKLKEPIIRLTLGKTSINLSFKEDKVDIQNLQNNDIGTINRNGEITIFEKSENQNVTLAILLQFSANPLKQILFYGAETGRCSFCGLELTHPTSLNFGYGKMCARNYNLPWD